MSRILYRNDQLIGEVSNWENTQTPPEYRDVLGKTVLVSKENDRCTFTSPKPLNKRDRLTLFDGQTKLILDIVKITSGLHVAAIIKDKIAKKSSER